jgi:arsenate reductase (thioredoxin)
MGTAFVVGLVIVGLAVTSEPPDARTGPGPIVFVCEHGNVKSLIATEWFNRLAAERGLAVRAMSRGLSPEPGVPGPIAERLRADGFDVQGFRPRVLAPEDLAGGSRLVMIGAEPPAWTSRAAVDVDRWDGIPPASERYEASRDALRERIAALLESLAPRRPAR